MKQIVICMILGLLVMPAHLMAQSTKTVVCIGDSNTSGRYPKFLRKELDKRWKVVDCGRSGAMFLSGCKYSYLDMPHYKKALDAKPDVVLIMMGTNDAMPAYWGSQRREPKFKGPSDKEFKSTYLGVIDALQALESKPRIFIVVPPPVFPDKAGNKRSAKGRNDNLVKHVIPLVKEIAKERDLPLIDLQSKMGESPELSADGIHFKRDGYQFMAEAFAKSIKEFAAKK